MYSLPASCFSSKSRLTIPRMLVKSVISIFLLNQVLTIDGFSKSQIDESLGAIQSKALNGDAHYQGILALYHKFGEKV